jgi:hypothetical protein
MSATKPFGNPETATIFVIGHDPRLQYSVAEAEFAFFLQYLLKPKPTWKPEAKKYELAQGVVNYISQVCGQSVSLPELLVTNLCNEFLPHTPNSGTVLIPEDLAKQGVEDIGRLVNRGRFQLILSMAVQPFYHLCRLGFIDDDTDTIKQFVTSARPNPTKAKQSIYVPTGKAPFLTVCGQPFHHQHVPVVPILHVKQWPLKKSMIRYAEPMQQAAQAVAEALQAWTT